MPYSESWEEPELAVESGGVKVYHVYRNDEISQGMRIYWYSVDAEEENADAGASTSFDVRDLRRWSEARQAHSTDDLAAAKAAIEQAIASGELTQDGVRSF